MSASGVGKGLSRTLAMRQMVTRNDALSDVTATERSLYSSFDAFTNEPGLRRAADALPKGGAVVGVSGGIFDLAARSSAELVVSVDQNPRIRDVIELFTATLLAADQTVAVKKLSPQQRAKEVAKLLSTSEPQEIAALGERLRIFGLREDLQADLPQLLAGVRKTQSGQAQFWTVTPGASSWLGSAEQIEHLTRLAREGRIVAITAELGDPGLPAKLNDVLRQRGVKVSALNLSNAREYMRGTSGPMEQLSQLDFAPGGKVLTTAARTEYALHVQRTGGGDVQVAMASKTPVAGAPVSAEDAAYFAEQGNFNEVALHDWDTFLGHGGSAQRYDPAVFRNDGPARMVEGAIAAQHLSSRRYPETPPSSALTSSEVIEAFYLDRDRKILGDPAEIRDQVSSWFKRGEMERPWRTFLPKIVDWKPFEEKLLGVGSKVELEAKVDELTNEFFTPARRDELVDRLLEESPSLASSPDRVFLLRRAAQALPARELGRVYSLGANPLLSNEKPFMRRALVREWAGLALGKPDTRPPLPQASLAPKTYEEMLALAAQLVRTADAPPVEGHSTWWP